ncbi:MAG TPA: TetR/AcrR family transcriptional regulator [Acidimicrobiales bacterium]|nr:TetR/AcrR family transcriptional regulator [Acidimicrobiales bacterium]
MSVKPLRVRQAEATRNLLLTVARENFTEHGYAATSIDDIIVQAGVARGALYHHFAGKEALFRAVYEAVEGEVVARVMEAAASQTSPWDALRSGLSMFLDACLEPAFRRIVVLDSVSVLQAQVMEIGIDPVELPMLRTVLTPLLGTTTFAGMGLDALTYVALGGLYGASLFIARAPDPIAARAEVDVVLDTLIGGLLPRPSD